MFRVRDLVNTTTTTDQRAFAARQPNTTTTTDRSRSRLAGGLAYDLVLRIPIVVTVVPRELVSRLYRSPSHKPDARLSRVAPAWRVVAAA
eukprot:scaffold27027_cov72-Phaeocystis_antarctica.AAC.3